MPSKLAIYWDSCVFLDRLKRHKDRIGLLEKITDAAAAGHFLIVTSSVTIAEVIKLPTLPLMLQEQVKQIELYFENAWISVRIVDEVIAKAAAEIRREHGLKTCDAIHLATALHFKIPTFHTYDGLNEDGTIKDRPCLLAFDREFGVDAKMRIIIPEDPNPQPPPAQPNLFPEPARILHLDP